MRYLRRKRTSKRRWIQRFRMGKPVPFQVLMEMPELHKRLKPHARYAINIDALVRA